MGAENQILQVDTGGPSNAIVKQPHKAKQFSKMSPTPLKKFVEGGVSDDQRRAINSIGFGSFLFLDVDEMPSDLCRWLLRHFDPFKCSINLKNSQLDVTVDDFHLALGLPKSGSNVQEAGRREATLEYNDLVTSWLNHLQRDRNNITISDVIAKMKQQVDGGDDFKRNFVIVVVSTLIKGNQKGLPNYKLLKSLGDVNSITSLNWSQFALESLTDCARDWQESDGTSLFTGPMLPLLLCYMDRVCFMGRLVNRQFPLIRWWKKKDVGERRNFELLKAGEFGTGDVKERIEAHNEGNQANNRSEQEFLRANTDSKKACIQKVAEAAHQLSIAFANFLEAMDDASIKFPKHEAIAKLSNLANSIVEVFEESEANALSVYFRGKLRRASAIPKFKVEELDLPSPKNSKMDAGIYLMRYMETFKGASKGFDHQLNDATDGFLKRLRVKYCSFILTNDANTLKLEIENKVKKLKGKNV